MSVGLWRPLQVSGGYLSRWCPALLAFEQVGGVLRCLPLNKSVAAMGRSEAAAV